MSKLRALRGIAIQPRGLMMTLAGVGCNAEIGVSARLFSSGVALKPP
jgi:hypothetical protein